MRHSRSQYCEPARCRPPAEPADSAQSPVPACGWPVGTARRSAPAIGNKNRRSRSYCAERRQSAERKHFGSAAKGENHVGRDRGSPQATVPAAAATKRRRRRQRCRHCRRCGRKCVGDNEDFARSGRLPGPSARRQALRQMSAVRAAGQLQTGRWPDQPARVLPDFYANDSDLGLVANRTRDRLTRL
jgi:hypothetical protein